MDEALFELVISPAAGAVPIRVPVTKRITTVGSSNDADIRLMTVPDRWAIVHLEDDGLAIRVVGGDERRQLAPGDSMHLDGIGLTVERRRSAAVIDRAVDQLVSALAGIDTADEALQRILEGAIAAAGADTGAVIVADKGDYSVAAARDADGGVLDEAAELLSDTIVADVLGTGERLLLTDVGAHQRYAAVPSVSSLRLRSVVCLPMRLDGKTLGAVFLGRRDRRSSFDDRVVAELKMLTAMAVPFLAQLRRTRELPGRDAIVGESAVMVEVKRLIARVAASDLGVLVLGPSGTGKELVARAIHNGSPRRERTLVAINCAAVPESLLGAELFGYRKGAFTNAATDRKGLVEAAEGSTLFLDEVGDMPMSMQSALLRVLEQREVTRLGENEPRSVDFRLVAATNRDLDADVAAGRFREDLLFRLREMTVRVPALRDRGDDVLLLAHCFLRQSERQLSLPPHSFSDEAEQALRSHPWPGNVRELKACVRRAAILAEGPRIRPRDLQLTGGTPASASTKTSPDAASGLGDLTRTLTVARDEFVRSYIDAVLDAHGGDRDAAAKSLGIGVRTLYRHLS